MPATEVATSRAIENVVNWKQHEETEEEMQVYEIKRRNKVSVNMLKGNLSLLTEKTISIGDERQLSSEESKKAPWYLHEEYFEEKVTRTIYTK